MLEMDDEVQEVASVGALPKKAPKVMNWTPPMSALILKWLSEVAARGAKTDKGFKEVEKLKVAKRISSFVGYDVSITQVHNHIRKWRNRSTRLVYLKALSGALWDDDKKMVVLEEQPYLGHTQVCMYMYQPFLNAEMNYLSAQTVLKWYGFAENDNVS